jgi:hypothetical protein
MHTLISTAHRFWRILLPASCLTFALVLLAEPGVAGGAKGPKATFVKGEVGVSATQDGEFKKLKRGRKVAPGNYVRTGDGARAELKFPDGSIVRIGPGSLMHVKESGFDGKTKEVKVETALIGGKAWANVAKVMGSEAKFQVKTQNAVAGVRGTVFRVNIDKDAATVVKVYNGAVAVSNSPFFTNQAEPKSLGPISKDRKQIAAPFQQVSKKEWEQIVQKMMVVRVGADGSMSKASTFTEEEDQMDEAEWVRWNVSCDKGNCNDY